MQIMLVEDDSLLADGIVRALKRDGFAVNWLSDGRAAQTSLVAEAPDVLVLDLGLPDMDGLELLAWLRGKGLQMPVLILTARDSTSDKVAGLDKGADDYLAKPFDIQELSARLRALERRLGMDKQSEIRNGTVLLDTAAHRVTVAGNEVSLSRREYMLLKALMEAAGSIQTRQALESKLYSWGEEVGSNTVEVHIHNLRKKLATDLIQTVRGIGYTIRKS
jgi:two-component system, OmpR family, response regulator